MARIINQARTWYISLLRMESDLKSSDYAKMMDSLCESTVGKKNRVTRLNPMFFLAVDWHCVGRYNMRVLEHRKDSYVKKHNPLRDCPRNAPDLLIEKVKSVLIQGEAWLQMKRHNAFILFDDDVDDVVASREDLTTFIVGFEGSMTRYVCVYSYQTIFVTTVLCCENPGSDWPDAIEIVVPVPENKNVPL